MKKEYFNMNPDVKNIVVCVDTKTTNEYAINSDFDDPYLEALTREIELGKKLPHLKIRPAIVCWDVETPKKPLVYNSYFVMLNAGLYTKAELLRKKFKAQHSIDLATEPLTSK